MAALAVAAFCYGTTENLPVGLLPLIAADLHESLSAVGMLVTGYGLTVAVVSVPLTQLTARIPRRFLLSGLLAVFVVTTWISVAASSYWVLLGARVATALSQAIFWPVAVVAAAGLFSSEVRGRASTFVFAGGSLAVVLGVPAGTWLGQQAGWRMAFLALSGLGVLALVAIAILLPSGPPGQGHTAATMIVTVAALAASMLGLYAFGTSPIPAVALMALLGFSLPGMVAALQLRVLQVAPGNTDIASAGTSAAFNVGIGGGALVGGLLLPTLGVRTTALASTLLATTALAVALTERLVAPQET